MARNSKPEPTERTHKVRRGMLDAASVTGGMVLGHYVAQKTGLPADADLWSKSANDAVLWAGASAPFVTRAAFHIADKVSDAVTNFNSRNLGTQFKKAK